jgi:hypothetical protein
VRDVCAAALRGPGERRNAVGDPQLHEAVVRGVIANLVDALSVAIEDAKLGRIPIGEVAELDHPLAAELAREPADLRLRPARTLPMEPFAQRRVGLEEVVVAERRRLVLDAMGR